MKTQDITKDTSLPIPQYILDALYQHTLEPILHPPGSTATAAAAAEHLGVTLGQIVNSLLFIDTGARPHLVLMAGNLKVSSGKLKRIIGSKPRLATSAEVTMFTNLAPGAVSPFGLQNIPIYCQQTLEQYSIIYPAAGTDCSSVAITFSRLVEITGALVVDVAQQS